MSRTASALTPALAAALVLASAPARAAWDLNLPPPVTPLAAQILDLHNLILWICVVIFIGVFGVMFYSTYAHRKSRGYRAAQFSHNTRLEILWSVIPAVILVVMAVPSTVTLIEMEDTTRSDLSVKITGYQWFWEYEYMDSGYSFYSRLSTPREQIENRAAKGEHYLLEVDNELVLPVGKKVRFVLTANDVIHAWWVPKLGIKKDAIPGYVSEMWAVIEKEGVYRGQCAELCGKDHGFMPIVVRAVSAAEFEAWLGERAASAAGAAETVTETVTIHPGAAVSDVDSTVTVGG
ncbi:MAG: cytochrome c oxidase subunit II [Gammaproteobacteria bacterium]|nr:cytochrome c oxidase subunit II [Gammaproteobacteria bacterium]MDD9800680.1 cytochrome c oxidase subunit II [Gammaproteobacteria bacterium]MDD9814702.1 cytochrome c oxidase subunit II [Gammaproteobacteria bacterium]MDD9850568.1 cytochrome c oxidase subunit II [Gammaproteobacteria bacterium]MDD9870435.1 cytochrome c oxidase subunit II [Gammaproteobacteria bacterium]